MSHTQPLDFLANISPEYLEQLTRTYAQDPSQLPLSWQIFFAGIELGKSEPVHSNGNGHHHANGHQINNHAAPQTNGENQVDLERRILNLIEGYRQRGHLLAQIDPLNRKGQVEPAHLELARFELEQIPTNKIFRAAKTLGLTEGSLRDIVQHLQSTYCRSLGVEYMHISDENAKRWLESRMEPSKNTTTFSTEDKIQFLRDIAEATLFEEFLQKNFTGQKRFSLEGNESVIPAMKQIVRHLTKAGVSETVVGMAHRGRLNVLVNVMQKPLENLFSEFFGASFSHDFTGSGDVKYHMGYSTEIDVNGKNLHVSLAFNPSHLEAVNPVVQGMVRAKQNHRYQGNQNSIVPLLIHGDAAVVGQGVVNETLNLAGLKGYSTGGTLHIVINNQIGFTTQPEDSRTSLYCTDFAKAIQSPVFHVNGDDVFAVMHAVTLATEFRMAFNRDVFVDIYGYRKYGHNEGDEPRFTQPDMYERIGKQKTALEVYASALVQQGTVTTTQVEEIKNKIWQHLESALVSVKAQPRNFAIEAFGKHWQGLRPATEADLLVDEKFPVSATECKEIIALIHTVPPELKPLSKYARMLETRLQKVHAENKIDWAVGEQLAFGTILRAGYSVRLSGQDSKRGTFSHRHIEITDITTEQRLMPLRKLESDTAKLEVYNSPLSEYAVLGFDYGYALAAPRTLTLWEAQFGDFANGAQIMIDQFIAASESKWRRTNGLTLLLPHGYEGQGPEHSSARLERFLQLAAEGNMQVVYPTTPAQFFHLLRRQVLRDFRKPLIVMTPKSPLRMPEVVSPLQDLLAGQFHNLLITGATPEKAKAVVFCTGKVYWDLHKKGEEQGLLAHSALVRVEQLYPLDRQRLADVQKIFKSANDWVWCQEEPQNMGAWEFFRLQTLDMNLPLRYAGRTRSASPATGSPKTHAQEQESLLNSALNITKS